MELPVIYIFTHDSIGVGEDGPTHQPVEQLLSLRAIPGLVVLRPGDANEVVEAYRYVLQLRHQPAVIALSRQPLPTFDRSKYASAAGVAAARAALGWTLDYVKERHAFGQPVGTFQNSRFVLAEIATEVEIGQSFVDRCVMALGAGELTAEEAAMAKWWCTELQKRVVDRCLQLFGGYGYMLEYPIARAYADARVHRIYAGTTEIMKELVARSL
jgi:alkylation response protein AidB-like acyl-CoA dehydrogenase